MSSKNILMLLYSSWDLVGTKSVYILVGSPLMEQLGSKVAIQWQMFPLILPELIFTLRKILKMEQNETGCQAPQAPILCVNNCGFFGTAATMNMCSKCYKDMILKQEQAKLAASSIESIVNGGLSGSGKVAGTASQVGPSQTVVAPTLETPALVEDMASTKVKEGPSRCNTCRKRVGLTGFNCRCGNTFCAVHRYSDKHDCPFDYRAAAQDAIAKANPVVKADKLDKI